MQKSPVKLDVARLIKDMGGASAFARIAGVARTTPYRWSRQGRMSSSVLAIVKEVRPDLIIDSYFITGEGNGGSGSRSGT